MVKEDDGTDFVVAMDSIGAEIGTTTRRNERAKHYMSSTMLAKSYDGAVVAGHTAVEDISSTEHRLILSFR